MAFLMNLRSCVRPILYLQVSKKMLICILTINKLTTMNYFMLLFNNYYPSPTRSVCEDTLVDVCVSVLVSVFVSVLALNS